MGSWTKEDTLAGAPKWLNANDPNTSNDKDYAFLVDVDEAQVASNRPKGLKTPGWNLYREYADQNGNNRRIVEPLVVMKVAAADAGDLGITGNTNIEDSTVADS